MPESSSPSSGISQGQSENTTSPYAALAAHIRKLEKTDSGARAALARMSPDQALRPHEVAALAHALLAAGLEPARWQSAAWQRWALIAHGMALAGHDGTGRLGAQLLLRAATRCISITSTMVFCIVTLACTPLWSEPSPPESTTAHTRFPCSSRYLL